MTVTGLPENAEAPRTLRKPSFRADIEGLRGVAVVAVVLYHAHFGFSGGYVGVDVFFVLSGFLITGLMLDERVSTGAVGFAAFFARRIRRLLPASVLVFVATIALVMVLLGPLQVLELTDQAKWVALFGSNIWFSSHATDYLQAEGASPFQQYWSLAVEEQFYLVWPFLFAAACIGASGARAVNRRVLATLAVVIAASFALAVWWTGVRQPSAFFLLPARAWELGAGALLAVAVRRGARLPRPMALPLGWLGLGGIAAAMLLYSHSTVFPGWSALVPVLGTVLVLAAGTDDEDRPTGFPSVSKLLGTSVPMWFGRYSYSLYLWHWPLLVVFESRAGGSLPATQRSLLVAAAVALSVITYHSVENRVRFARGLVGQPGRTFALGGLLVAVALASTLALGTVSATSDAGEATVEGERTGFVPADLSPPLAAAKDDDSAIYTSGCQHGLGQAEAGTPESIGPCMFGAADGPVVHLTGDSHGGHWFPALEQAATDHGWMLRATTKASCPLAGVTVHREDVNRDYTECDAYREAVLAGIESDPPDLVVIAHKSAFYEDMLGEEAWSAGLADTVDRLARVTDVAVLRDNPWAAQSVPNCLSVNLEDVTPCEFAVGEADVRLAHSEGRAVEESGGVYLDPVEFVCPDGTCPAVVGNLLAFKDRHHLAPEFSRSLSDPLARLLAEAWDPAGAG